MRDERHGALHKTLLRSCSSRSGSCSQPQIRELGRCGYTNDSTSRKGLAQISVHSSETMPVRIVSSVSMQKD